MSKDAGEDAKEVIATFNEAVNMTPAALRKWLQSEESGSVGMLPGGGRKEAGGEGESVGHHMGERILAMKAKKQSELTEDDLADMRKVSGYVHRHLAQKPTKEKIEDSRWRYSLMNWGHDPLK